MNSMPLLLVALASLLLAGCEDKTKPTPDKPAAASPAPTQSAAKPAAAPAEGGW
jgi:outer membrane biogenesis lipoprotein LolB